MAGCFDLPWRARPGLQEVIARTVSETWRHLGPDGAETMTKIQATADRG
jgi:hypothetical protein